MRQIFARPSTIASLAGVLILAAVLVATGCATSPGGGNASARNPVLSARLPVTFSDQDPPYWGIQSIFAIATLPDLSSAYTADSQSDVATKITAPTRSDVGKILGDSTIKSLMGDWKVVWGPAVVARQNPSTGSNPGKWVASNTMLIARSDTQNMFIVAIAGTNAFSNYDWKDEDFTVFKTVHWPDAAPAESKIAQGTYDGLQALQGMTDGGQTALQYLQSVNPLGAYQVVVTGHSLGGTLTPVFALYLRQASPPLPNLAAVPWAGATAGSPGFVSYYAQQMGASTVRIWNVNDAVPAGFTTAGLNSLKNLYSPVGITLTALDPVQVDIDKILLGLSLYGVEYQHLGDPAAQIGFEGKLWNFSCTPQIPDPKLSKTDKRFLMEACVQHLDRYVDALEVQPFAKRVAQLLGRAAFFKCPIPCT